MTRPKLVVVGNGMAAARTLEHLTELAPDRHDITVFGAEPHTNYNRILLTPVLAGEMTPASIVLNDLDWYWSRGIRLHLGKEVTRIDRAKRRVECADGTTADYDRLLLATGSSPIVLPVPGREARGVITYRDFHDTAEMILATRTRTHAVVIGGGLLGLEAANGLAARGMKVTVIHLMASLMERQLDATAAALLQNSLEARGIAFRLGAQTKEILPDGTGRARAIRLDSGEEIPAELVVMAVGIRPDTALAKAAGLRCARGVAVDDTLQTWDPVIYAVGECAEHRGIVYGLVAPLYEMAAVCADHLAGVGRASFRGSVPATRLKVTGIEVFSAGDFSGGDGCESLVLEDREAGIYRKVVIRDHKVIGAVLYGDTATGAWLGELIRSGAPVDALRDALLFGPDVAAPRVADAAIANNAHEPLRKVA